MSRTRTRSRWWSKARGLPAEVYASLVESLRAAERPTDRILAWATIAGASGDPRGRGAGEEQEIAGFCVGFPAVLSYGNTDGWTHVGWHEIESGNWNSETGRLSWRTYEGRRGMIDLAEPARLPELFRERIAASLVVEKFVALEGRRGVTISGRRDLAAPDRPIVWHRSLTRGVTWQTEGVEELAERALEEVRAEYDIRG